MANKKQLMRYLIIDEMLRNKQRRYPSKQEIIDRCQERTDKNYSDSSLEKDLRAMRVYFNAPIEFHNLKRGYFYGLKERNEKEEMIYEEDENYKLMALSLSQKDVIALNLAESILRSFKEIAFYKEFSDAVDKVLDAVEIDKQLGDDITQTKNIIQLDRPFYMKGSHLLSELVRAIREQKQVTFEYKKFDKEEASQKVIHPYFLKEFKGRWYLLGYSEDKKAVVTFGLDRMNDLGILEDKIIPAKKVNFDPENHYKYCYGVTRKEKEEPQNIILSFEPIQGNYIKTQPLHHTQKELVDNAEEYRISLDLIINPEIIMQILSYGEGVKVMQPKSLVENMKEIWKKALAKHT